MAARYGGKFSPQGQSGSGTQGPESVSRVRPSDPAPVHPFHNRPRWLMLAGMPFLFTAFGEAPLGLAIDLAAFGCLGLSAFLTREGLKAEMAYQARKIARRPALPRKIIGAVITGLGLGLGAYDPAHGLAGPLILGLVGAVLHHLTFGPDPLSDKGMEGIDAFQQDRVARVVDTAEQYLTGMRAAILRARDDRMAARVDLFIASARELIRAVENDPRDLTAARKYLVVYLMGARDATVAFADLFGATRDAKAQSDYVALLTDLETNFTARTRSLIEGGRADLDLEIDVLRDRLAREGVVPKTPSET
jgi:hypothetical protein